MEGDKGRIRETTKKALAALQVRDDDDLETRVGVADDRQKQASLGCVLKVELTKLGMN